ncbi:dual specificity protein phosphatase 23 [Fimbriiglobus ruber]|uniref:Protein tyrosine phosphatase n=1 Tax=Fimbriiglobus ruber TaxID=1908690 RepID=A0A225DWD4_9BACT|nr:dual specificity protein phosphatase 23 [Fimbriiglobus ruber]OWK45692.1 Protein tyrosine phosphatase [Fimbriiglobus ruber]
MPPGFTWVDRPRLAAHAMPGSAADLTWLRQSGIEVLLSLSESPPPRHWVNEAGMMAVHVPVPDMTAPTDRQIDLCLDTITRAVDSGMGVSVHCTAGKGRTGTVLAAYFVAQGLTADAAIRKVRTLRPGSVETAAQERAVEELEERLRKA